MMAIRARNELSRAASCRYLSSSKKEKGVILDEFCSNSGLSRKHALRLLRNPPPQASKRTRDRKSLYGELETNALRRVWPLSGFLSARRLVAGLPDLFEACERFSEWVPDEPVKAKLLKMSASTCARLLKPIRPTFPRKGVSTTSPGLLLKAQIATRLGTEWNEAVPGFVEADLVAHCGPTNEGSFVHTLTITDIATGWTELAALKSKGQVETTKAIEQVQGRIPFPLLGLDTDNGSEFINYHLKAYCDVKKIKFTRSRPYVKNDGCHVEQKNGAVVRKNVGHSRYETEAEFCTLEELYRVLRKLVNFFEPSAKLTKTKTEAGKTKKKYDKPMTPYRRFMQSESAPQEAKDRLEKQFLALNPVRLRNQLRILKQDLMKEDLVRILDDSTR